VRCAVRDLDMQYPRVRHIHVNILGQTVTSKGKDVPKSMYLKHWNILTLWCSSLPQKILLNIAAAKGSRHEPWTYQTVSLRTEGQYGGYYCSGNDLDSYSRGAQFETWPGHWPTCLRVMVLLYAPWYRFSASLNPWLLPSKSVHFVFYPSPNNRCHRITCDLFPVPRFEVQYSMSWMMIDCTMW
jgi:hypothetical protein